MLLVIKKIIGWVLMPAPMGSSLIAVGLALNLWCRRRQSERLRRFAGIFLYSGISILLVFSTPLVSRGLVSALETRYQPLSVADFAEKPFSKTIAVLGSEYFPETGLPVTMWIHGAFQARIMECVRLKKLMPECRLIISLPGKTPDYYRSMFIKEFCSIVSIESDGVEFIADAVDTRTEIYSIKALSGGEPVVLVTSALHMPRAVLQAQKAGLSVTPAPCDYISGRMQSRWFPSAIIPGLDALRYSHRACHEYIGLLWVGIRG